MATVYRIQDKFNLKYKSRPKLLSYIKYLTQSWHICQNKAQDEKLECATLYPTVEDFLFRQPPGLS